MSCDGHVLFVRWTWDGYIIVLYDNPVTILCVVNVPEFAGDWLYANSGFEDYIPL